MVQELITIEILLLGHWAFDESNIQMRFVRIAQYVSLLKAIYYFMDDLFTAFLVN